MIIRCLKPIRLFKYSTRNFMNCQLRPESTSCSICARPEWTKSLLNSCKKWQMFKESWNNIIKLKKIKKKRRKKNWRKKKRNWLRYKLKNSKKNKRPLRKGKIRKVRTRTTRLNHRIKKVRASKKWIIMTRRSKVSTVKYRMNSDNL